MFGTPKKGGKCYYDPEVGKKIVERVCRGESIKSICKGEGMPNCGIVWRWRMMGREPDCDPQVAEFTRQMDIALEMRADVLIDECQDIADDDSNDTLTNQFGEASNPAAVSRAKLRIDTRKAVAALYARERYGRSNRSDAEADSGVEEHRLVIEVDPTPLAQKQAEDREGA